MGRSFIHEFPHWLFLCQSLFPQVLMVFLYKLLSPAKVPSPCKLFAYFSVTLPFNNRFSYLPSVLQCYLRASTAIPSFLLLEFRSVISQPTGEFALRAYTSICCFVFEIYIFKPRYIKLHDSSLSGILNRS